MRWQWRKDKDKEDDNDDSEEKEELQEKEAQEGRRQSMKLHEAEEQGGLGRAGVAGHRAWHGSERERE